MPGRIEPAAPFFHTYDYTFFPVGYTAAQPRLIPILAHRIIRPEICRKTQWSKGAV
jgi:hypothetical protein